MKVKARLLLCLIALLTLVGITTGEADVSAHTNPVGAASVTGGHGGSTKKYWRGVFVLYLLDTIYSIITALGVTVMEM